MTTKPRKTRKTKTMRTKPPSKRNSSTSNVKSTSGTGPKRKKSKTSRPKLATKTRTPRARSPRPPAVAPAASRAPGQRSPRGFNVYAGQASARDRISRRLADTQDALEGLRVESDYHVHEYKNGTVDGELTIAVPRGTDPVELMKKLETAFGMDNQPGMWFQVGVRFGVHSADFAAAAERYRRHKGALDFGLHYRRMFSRDDTIRRSIFGDAFGMMEHRVIGAIQDKYERKVQTVLVRLHWNPQHVKPER